MIDTNCPMIFEGNWKVEHSNGWRFVKNLPLDDGKAKLAIKSYQEVHGVLNVAVGQPFNEHTRKPAPAMTTFGLYVRDVDDLVKDIRDSLDNPVAVASWLNGD